jgi:hypothetical protein
MSFINLIFIIIQTHLSHFINFIIDLLFDLFNFMINYNYLINFPHFTLS